MGLTQNLLLDVNQGTPQCLTTTTQISSSKDREETRRQLDEAIALLSRAQFWGEMDQQA